MPALLAALEGREITRGGHSWLERRFLSLVAAAGLPRPITQQVLSRAGDRLVRVDCRFPGTNVVVEVLGYRWHRSKEQLARDAEHLNALILDGFAPFQFTYDQVVRAGHRTRHTRSCRPPFCVSEQDHRRTLRSYRSYCRHLVTAEA